MWLIIAGTVGERETNSSSVAEGGKQRESHGYAEEKERKGRQSN